MEGSSERAAPAPAPDQVPPPKRGLRSLVATRFRKAVLAVVLLLLAGATTAIQQWIRNAGETATKSVLPQLGGAPLTIRVAHLGTFDSGTLPFPYYVVPKSRLSSPLAIDAAARGRLFAPQSLDADWATKQGGIPGSPGVVRLELRGKGSEPVLVNAIRPEVVARKPAVKGWYIAAGACGIEPVRSAEMNLDAAPPSVEYYADDTSPPTKRLTLSVTRTDPEQVELHAITRNALVEWRAKVFYSGPEGDGSLTVDDNGRPFRVTTETSSDGYESAGSGSVRREHFWDKSGIRMC